MLRRLSVYCSVIFLGVLCGPSLAGTEQQPVDSPDGQDGRQTTEQKHTPEQLEAAFKKMLSGATLEGSFTSTGKGSNPAELSSEKYTLGEVEKIAGDLWRIPARIQYGDKDLTLPLVLPVRWADDTPVIVVDEVGLPGFGTVSARVMFFADHYAGFWKHGKSGGHLFGVIRRDEHKTEDGASDQSSAPSIDSAGGEQVK